MGWICLFRYAEKKYFSTKKLEYLIEQTQFNGNEVLNKNDQKNIHRLQTSS